jgi:hypothetical protein
MSIYRGTHTHIVAEQGSEGAGSTVGGRRGDVGWWQRDSVGVKPMIMMYI